MTSGIDLSMRALLTVLHQFLAGPAWPPPWTSTRLAVLAAGTSLTLCSVAVGLGRLEQQVSPEQPAAIEAARALAASTAFTKASPEAAHFEVLFRSPTAARALHRLLDEGSAAGKLYGLCGVLGLSSRSFHELETKLAGNPQSVFILQGVLARSSPLAAALRPPAPLSVPAFTEVCRSLLAPGPRRD
jgi:hypothetical protein